jgi:hypothetical protein
MAAIAASSAVAEMLVAVTSLAIAALTINVVMGEIATAPDCTTPDSIGSNDCVSESVQPVAVTIAPASNTEAKVYVPLPTSVATAPSELTLQPIAAPSKTSTDVVALVVAPLSPPPPQADTNRETNNISGSVFLNM